MPERCELSSGGNSPSSTNSVSETASNASEKTVASARSASQISKALKQARREARRLQMRIKLPALLLGTLLMGGSMWWVYTSWTPDSAAYLFVRDTLRSAGCIAWLCACLPSDRWAPKVGCTLLFILGVKCAWWHTHTAVQYMKGHLGGDHSCEIEGEHIHCLLGAFTIYGQTVLYDMMHLWQLPYLLRALWLPSRASNARQWVALAWLHFTKGASDFLVILPAITVRAVRSGHVPYAVIAFSMLHGIYAISMGMLLRSPQFRQRVHFTLLSQSGALTAAASIAAFIGNWKPKKIIEIAKATCRCVSLDKVTEEHMQRSTPDMSLRAHSESCRLQDIDAFLSHSWHDPADAKWEALQAWRQKFKKQHNREPRLWIDKYCIDQGNIEASLMCLPVFLAGCHSLLILAGSTYLSRLWCVEEVFVYLQMGRPVASVELFALCPDMADQISNFDVHAATCFQDVDRQTLLATIEAGCDSFDAFNLQVRLALEQASKVASYP